MNLEMLKVLVSPLAYLRIRHDAKLWSDWVYPIAFSLISVALIFNFGDKDTIGGEEGLLQKLLVAVSVLPGFYIAALAAIATFNGRDIDSAMPDPAPTMSIKLRGHSNKIALTRRRFLSHLFSFLCFESLFLMVACVFAGLVGTNVVTLLQGNIAHGVTIVFVFLVLLAFWQMICVTCLGLYYLGDRLHRPTY